MNSVIIVAAGSGKRMNLGINKQYIKLEEKEMIAHTIDTFYNNGNVDKILNKYNYKNVKIAYGGEERQDSIYNGLKKINRNCEIVLIHDGARPFVSDDIINKSIEVAKEKQAVVVGVPVKDTIKVVENGIVKHTPQRSTLWSAQTPQTFKYDLIMKAYEEAYKNNYYGTDDSMLVEFIGQNVSMIMGSYDNIKITNPEDINIAKKILEQNKN